MSGSEWKAGEIDEHQLAIIRPVIERYQQYWPLSMRQVYYQVVKEGGAGLWLDELATFSMTIRAALIEGLLPLVALAEDARELREGGAWEDAADFVHSEIESFLWGYRRDLLQGQEHFVEVWVQKPDVLGMIADIALEYCVTTVCCRHLPTVKFMQELRTRLGEARERSQSAVILFFGDYSPQKPGFLARVRETLRADGNLWEMEFRHESLTVDDVVKYDLPESVVTRSGKLHGGAEPGMVPVELEALPPDVLDKRVRLAIEAQLDVELLNNQRAIQSRESLRLGKLRTDIMRRVRSILRQQMPRGEG